MRSRQNIDVGVAKLIWARHASFEGSGESGAQLSA